MRGMNWKLVSVAVWLMMMVPPQATQSEMTGPQTAVRVVSCVTQSPQVAETVGTIRLVARGLLDQATCEQNCERAERDCLVRNQRTVGAATQCRQRHEKCMRQCRS